jgi:hypothetical protein
MMHSRQWLLPVLAVVSMHTQATQPLPRVFYAPQERSAITAMRRAGPQPNATVAVVTASDAEAAPTSGGLPRVMKLDGISLARTGGLFAWIGGKRFADGAQFGSWQLQISQSGVALRRNGRVERQLRVGEAIGQGADVQVAP